MKLLRTLFALSLLIPLGSFIVVLMNECLPGGGVIGGITYIATLLFFGVNICGILLLRFMWNPNYMTPDGMPVGFWIAALTINWVVIVTPLFILRLCCPKPKPVENK
jgi:hypothetical protein